MSAVAMFFGGPDDGSTKVLGIEDLAAGFVDTRDSEGQSVRHTIVKLEQPKQIDDIVVEYELRPTEGAW